MEKLQGPINPCSLIAEDLEVGNWLEEFISSTTKFEDPYNNNNNNVEGAYNYNNCYGDYSPHFTLPSLEDKMPFLQMLQSVESSQHYHQQQATFPLMQLEPNFQFLLRLQHQKVTCFTTTPEMIVNHNHHNTNHNITNNNNNHHHHHNNGMIIRDLHSSSGVVKSETDNNNNNNFVNNHHHHHHHHQSSGVAAEEVSEVPLKSSRSKRNNNINSMKTTPPTTTMAQQNKEKRKRKRTTTRPAKNKEEVETQRMTHIAVERNRRRQMNEHLNALRSLMPPSYAQRGDQASIIGGAIDFVKELEQMLQSLQAQKKMRQSEENGDVSGSTSTTTTTTTTTSSSSNMFMDSSHPFHQLSNPIPAQSEEVKGKGNGSLSEGNVRKSNEEYSAEKKSALADIEVVVIQNHVNLKIQCQKRPGQLLKAIVAFEELRLTVLHLNITSLHALVHYSFNLKIEDDCKLGSADEVARAVHQIFSFINLN